MDNKGQQSTTVFLLSYHIIFQASVVLLWPATDLIGRLAFRKGGKNGRRRNSGNTVRRNQEKGSTKLSIFSSSSKSTNLLHFSCVAPKLSLVISYTKSCLCKWYSAVSGLLRCPPTAAGWFLTNTNTNTNADKKKC